MRIFFKVQSEFSVQSTIKKISDRQSLQCSQKSVRLLQVGLVRFLRLKVGRFTPSLRNHAFIQECIPVGCVPSAAAALCWGVGGICLSTCWDTHPRPWTWTPSGPRPGHPAWPDPQPPPGSGPRHPSPSQTPQPPPWAWT